MRAAASLLVLVVQLTGCSLMQPAGARPIVVQVTNTALVPVLLTIESPAGVLPGAVQPSTLPAGGKGEFTFFLPQGDDWSIMVNGWPMFSSSDLSPDVVGSCGSFMMEVSPDGGGAIGCTR